MLDYLFIQYFMTSDHYTYPKWGNTGIAIVTDIQARSFAALTGDCYA